MYNLSIDPFYYKPYNKIEDKRGGLSPRIRHAARRKAAPSLCRVEERVSMIRAGFIGLGTIAQLNHLPVLQSLRDMYQITAVNDLSPALTAEIAKMYSAKAYASPEELVKADDVDLVFVLSPDQYHHDIAKLAIEADKHVFIEKPVVLDPAELEDLMELEKKHPNKVHMVGYMRRFSQGFLQCKKMLEEDDRPIKYMRFRDIILEGGYFIGQTKKPLRFNDIPPEKLAESKKRRYDQISAAIGADCTAQQRLTYPMFTGLGCHTLAAVRELVGYTPKVLNVTVDGEHAIVTFQFKGFIGVYEVVNDQDIVQFDAAIEIYQGDRRMKIKHETPYLRYQPGVFEVAEATKDDCKFTTYGPDYHDSFENEVRYLYDCITEGKKPKTSFADSMEDLRMYQDIVSKINQ